MKDLNKILKKIYTILNKIDDLRHKHSSEIDDEISKIDNLIEENMDKKDFDKLGEDHIDGKLDEDQIIEVDGKLYEKL